MSEQIPNLKASLANIQAELRAPKNKRNSFGGYSYRSAEDILEAVKPLCKKYGVVLTLFDEMEAVNGRIYVCSTARLSDVSSNAEISTSAYAREAETKKGMDDSQVTGTASSYARKYALNGLFCIDDNQDADTEESVRAQVIAQVVMVDNRQSFNALQRQYLALIKRDMLIARAFERIALLLPKESEPAISDIPAVKDAAQITKEAMRTSK